MRTIGEILKKARVEKKLAYEDIENQLRIRKKFLLALEENTWNKLPSLPYIKGFIRSYSQLLGLKPDEMVAIFRRQFASQEKAGLLPDGVTRPLDEPIIRITPTVTTILLIFLSVFLFFGYLFIQYTTLTNPPPLTLEKPLEGETFFTESVPVKGKTDKDAVVSVNNQKIALSEAGEFSTNVSLPAGINTILIETIGKNGKKNSTSRTIQVTPK